jgi:hypothetical protein
MLILGMTTTMGVQGVEFVLQWGIKHCEIGVETTMSIKLKFILKLKEVNVVDFFNFQVL